MKYTIISTQRRGYLAHYHWRQQRSHTTNLRGLVWSFRNYWNDYMVNVRRLPGESQARYTKRMNEQQETRAALMMFRMARPRLIALAWFFAFVILATVLLIVFGGS